MGEHCPCSARDHTLTHTHQSESFGTQLAGTRFVRSCSHGDDVKTGMELTLVQAHTHTHTKHTSLQLSLNTREKSNLREAYYFVLFFFFEDDVQYTTSEHTANCSGECNGPPLAPVITNTCARDGGIVVSGTIRSYWPNVSNCACVCVHNRRRRLSNSGNMKY